MTAEDPKMRALPHGWRWVAVKDLAADEPRAITDGPFGSNLKTAHYTDEGPRVIRLQNIGDGEFVDARAHIDEHRFNELRAHEAQPGDIVMASLGEALPRACLVPDWLGPAIVKADCPRLRPGPDVHAPYLVAALNSPIVRAQAASVIRGVGRPRLPLAALKKLLVPVPPLAEQKKIMGELDDRMGAVRGGVSHLENARRRLHAFRRSVLSSALFGAGEASEPSPLPIGWRWSKVSDEGEVKLGRMRSPERHQGPNMRPYLRVANVLDDRLDLSDVDSMDFPPDEYERYRLEYGDILLNEGQSPELLGRAAMWREEQPGMCYQKSLIRFRAGAGVDAEFALLVFRHYLYCGRFRRESRITTGIAHLTAVRFAAIEFPVPPLQVQRRIVKDVRAQFAGADALEHALGHGDAKAFTLRRALLRDAVLGRLVERPGVSAGNDHGEAERPNNPRAVLVGS